MGGEIALKKERPAAAEVSSASCQLPTKATKYLNETFPFWDWLRFTAGRPDGDHAECNLYYSLFLSLSHTGFFISLDLYITAIK